MKSSRERDLALQLKPGDRVFIKSLEELADISGATCLHTSMCKWAGLEMTVRRYSDTYTPSFYMLEDKDEFDGNTEPGWVWDYRMLDFNRNDIKIDPDELNVFLT